MNQTTLFDPVDLSRKAARSAALAAARARADTGMQRAADKAGSGWCEAACEALRKLAASTYPGMFTIENARLVLARELPAPTDGRAWGRVTVMSVSRGYIQRAKGNKTQRAARSNGSEKPLWTKGPKA